MRIRIHSGYISIIITILCLTFLGQARADYWDFYENTVLEDNPLVYLRFNDSDMNDGAPVADLGSLGKGGTYVSKGGSNSISPIYSGIWVLGQAAYLGQGNTSSGNGDCIDIDDTDMALNLSDCTYEAWIKIAPGDLNHSRIFQHNGDWLEEGGPGIMMEVEQYGVIGGDSTDYMDVPTYYGYWRHVVVTYDSTGSSVLKELYIDGELIGTAIAPNDLRYAFDHIIIGAEGGQFYLYNELKGAIDEFAIYEGILGADRIAQHFVVGIPEPATIALLGLGGLALIRKRRV